MPFKPLAKGRPYRQKNRDMDTNKKLIIGLYATCTALTILSAILGFLLFGQPRFTHVGGPNDLYIMFDQRTAQACWSGGPKAPEPLSSPPPGFIEDQIPTNRANLPFCKDLK